MNSRLSTLLAFVLVIAGGPAFADSPPETGIATEWARVDTDARDQPRALQVAIATYVPAQGTRDFSVDLISAVHVGDEAYYQELNERFSGYDAVLYELIAHEGNNRPRASPGKRSMISRGQLSLKTMLDLSFQLDHVDYQAENLVHADLSPTELKQSMADRGESLYTYFWNIFFMAMNDVAKDPLGTRANSQMMMVMLDSEQENAFRTMMAYEMTRGEIYDDFLGGEDGSAIIAARNQRAIDILQEQLQGGARRVGIFYGAAHMPDFEARLKEQLGLEYAATDWVDAWQLSSSGDRD